MSDEKSHHESAKQPRTEPFANVECASRDLYEQVYTGAIEPTSIRLPETLLKSSDTSGDSTILSKLGSASTTDEYIAFLKLWSGEPDKVPGESPASTSGQSASSDPYEQVPLNIADPTSIRLLSILPSRTDDSIISCRLCSASTKNKYIALSYMWGGEEDQEIIELNGCKVAVRRNLWNFLHQKRMDKKRDGIHMFWIDALCINQGGVTERNHQVAMMGKIYSRAASVLIWMGAERDMINLLTDLEKIKGNSEGRAVCFQEWWEQEPRETTLRGIYSLYEYRYWRRAWILQEFVLATKLYLQSGPHQISERHVREMHNFLKPRGLIGRCTMMEHMETLDPETFRWGKTKRPNPMLSVFEARAKWRDPAGRTYANLLVDWESPLECSDPRDKIYSKLAIMDKSMGIIPDYSKTPAELFQDIADKCFTWNDRCYSNLMGLMSTLDIMRHYPGILFHGDYPEIKDLIFQAQITEDYYRSSESEEAFFDQDWDDYARRQPTVVRKWLQKSPIGQQQLTAAREQLGKSCRLRMVEEHIQCLYSTSRKRQQNYHQNSGHLSEDHRVAPSPPPPLPQPKRSSLVLRSSKVKSQTKRAGLDKGFLGLKTIVESLSSRTR